MMKRKNILYVFSAFLFFSFGGPGSANAKEKCFTDIPANEFIRYARSKSNNFVVKEGIMNETSGSCMIHDATALANAGTEEQKKCSYEILSRDLKPGWHLSDIEFFSDVGQGVSNLQEARGSFDLIADLGTSSSVTLVSVKICSDTDESDNWKAAF